MTTYRFSVSAGGMQSSSARIKQEGFGSCSGLWFRGRTKPSENGVAEAGDMVGLLGAQM